jgi:flavorubredoxin
MDITEDIRYIGVNDHEIDLFEGQYAVANGMAYNSYVLLDEKTAVLDTVDGRFTAQWLENLSQALAGREPDYLVVHHMEPDHSGSITAFMERYPQAVLVATAKAFSIGQNFFGTDYADRRLVVGQGDTLSLGQHTLQVIPAPMVHWPEVMVTYDERDKVLFSADAFGKFGALDTQEDWTCEARRYYFGIVGKFGVQVQGLLKKLSALDVQKICPLHGPVLTEDLAYYFNLYNIWSSYGVESEGVMIAYTSVYGNTKQAVALLAETLEDRGCPKVVVTDLARDDMAEAVEDAFRYGTLVLATTTYNGGAFPAMKEFIHHLCDHAYQNRRVAFVENGSWAPMAAKAMGKALEGQKNLTFASTTVSISSALSPQSRSQIQALAEELWP